MAKRRKSLSLRQIADTTLQVSAPPRPLPYINFGDRRIRGLRGILHTARGRGVEFRHKRLLLIFIHERRADGILA
jgi:hypothetical protein